MAEQLHKRVFKETVEEVLKAFDIHEMSEKQACMVLGIKRSRLYDLRKHWLQSKDEPFTLYKPKYRCWNSIDEDVGEFLHSELKFVREQANHSRGKFNFASLSEEVDKRFGYDLSRNTIRRFAIKQGYVLLHMK